MKATSIKNTAAKALVVLIGVVALMGFASVTRTAEQRAVSALDHVVTAPGVLYAEPATVHQLATVVVTGKRSS